MSQLTHKKHIIFDFDETLCTLLIDWGQWHERMEKLYLSYEPTFHYKTVDEFVAAQNIFIEKFGKEIRDKMVETSWYAESHYYEGYMRLSKSLKFFDSVKNSSNVYLWTSNDIRTVLPIL